MNEQLSKASFEREVAMLTEAWAAALKVRVNSKDYPIVDLTFMHAVPLRLKLVCDNWPELPPSVELMDELGRHLKPDALSRGGIFNSSAHPSTGRPFVCMRGTREYHTHSSHRNEKWEAYRGQEGMGIVGIALQIGSAWKKAR